MRFFSNSKAVITKSVRVVLLDNSLVVRYTLRNLLHIFCQQEQIDLQIYTSEDGVQGLGYIFIERPEIIIVDTTLPKYSGREVVEFLATNSQIKESKRKLIVLTSGANTGRQTPGQIIIDKRDPLFIVKLLHHIASLTGHPKAEIATSLIAKFRQYLAKKAIWHTELSDQNFDNLQRLTKLAWPYYAFKWLLHQLILSTTLTLFRLVTKNHHEANLVQKDKDNAQFRARYYPTLAIILTSILILIVQLLAYFASGLLLFQVADRVTPVAAAYANGYSYRRAVTIQESQIPGSTALTSFPVLVSGTYSYLATTGNGGKVTNASGFDIIFTSDAAGSTKLDHEIERYVASTGEIVMWVEIASLSATANTTIYMFYGNSSISTSQENETGTWTTNYKLVQHLEEGTTGATDFRDSSTSANHSDAVVIDGTGSNANATGKIGPAVQFDGSNDYIRFADSTTLDRANTFSITLWFNADTLPNTSRIRAMFAKTGNVSLETSGTQTNYSLAINNGLSGGGHWLNSAFENTAHTDYAVANSFTHSTSTWYHVAVVFNNTADTYTLYRNGTQVQQATGITGTPAANAKPAYIGVDNAAELSGFSEYFDGIIDEVRFSQAALSGDWIAAEYNNQNTPSSFYTVGDEVTNTTYVSSTGSQTGSMNIPSTGQYVGGAFTIAPGGVNVNVTGITIREQGTVNGAIGLNNILLRYELDNTAPLDCASESYAGSETQFGTTDTDGFSADGGESSFTGSVAVATYQAMCVYVVLDITSSATNGQTLEIDIANASTKVTVSSGDVSPASTVAISGTTTLSEPVSVNVTTAGSQTSTINGPVAAQYVGGYFIISGVTGYGNRTITSITITENGTTDAQNHLDNIVLRYDIDNTNPYDCSADSYAAGDTQFGSTDTDGFSAANGTATFTGSQVVSNTQVMCLYVVFDVVSGAVNGQTIEIEISNPSTQVVQSSGTVSPGTAVAISNTSTLSVAALVTVSTSGSQQASVNAGSTNSYLGGSLNLLPTGQNNTVTGITITHTGSVDGFWHLDNIKLLYELDTSAPYDCASESYAGSETQFGSTATTGFSLTSNTAAFTGSVAVTVSQAMCVYVVMDISSLAGNTRTIEVEITTPSSQVTVSTGTVTPGSAVAISGTTTVSALSYTVNLQVDSGSDNAWDIAGSGSLNTASPMSLGGRDASNNAITAGLRFNSVTVPNGALINSARLDFRESFGGDYSTFVKTRNYAEAADNAGTYTTGSLPRSRSLTSSYVDWDSNGIIVTAGNWYSTSASNQPPDFASIVQEVVNRSGWSSGNSLSIISQDDGSSTDWWYEVYSYASGASNAPRISINYTTTAVSVTTTGTQTTSINANSSNQYVGGAFAIKPSDAHAYVTAITITEQGTVDATVGLDNIKLYYEFDSSAPYDCASESYAGTETQYGATDTDGFNAANGSSTFSSRVRVETTQAMCVYPVLDVTTSVSDQETIEIQISSPNSGGVTLSSGSVSTSSNVAISGTTTIFYDAPPVVSSVSLNGGSNINLTENTTTSISATATITDANGYGDITTVISKIYRSGVASAQSCATDNNNCYSSTCSLSGCSGNSCTATCTINMQFHADPTESGSNYASEYWLAWVQATDASTNNATAFSPNNVTEVNKLVALNVTNSISYGSLLAGGNTGGVNQTTVITNTGNTPIDLEVSGTNLCTDYPTCGGSTITVGQQQYSTGSFSYGSGTTLSTSPTTVNVSLVKPTNSPSNSSGSIYWGIALPSQIGVGSYTGQNNVIAIPDN